MTQSAGNQIEFAVVKTECSNTIETQDSGKIDNTFLYEAEKTQSQRVLGKLMSFVSERRRNQHSSSKQINGHAAGSFPNKGNDKNAVSSFGMKRKDLRL